MIDECDISTWVTQQSDVIPRPFREAIHTILYAIGKSSDLNTRMLMKGGILLAIRYRSSRFTRDVDFSTTSTYADFNRDSFNNEISKQLTHAVEALDYALDCKIQSSELRPRDENSTFPTLKLKIGYAYKNNSREHKRLLAGQAPNIVELDYSFNEPAPTPDFLSIGDGATICAYTYADLIAEKFRAVLQQPIRKRYRRQDVYDLFLLLEKFPLHDQEEIQRVLQSLLISAQSRQVSVHAKSMQNPEVRSMSQHDYETLAAEIDEDLPDFDVAYDTVREFYESLPWR